jgi:hypothetical protein
LKRVRGLGYLDNKLFNRTFFRMDTLRWASPCTPSKHPSIFQKMSRLPLDSNFLQSWRPFVKLRSYRGLRAVIQGLRFPLKQMENASSSLGYQRSGMRHVKSQELRSEKAVSSLPAHRGSLRLTNMSESLCGNPNRQVATACVYAICIQHKGLDEHGPVRMAHPTELHVCPMDHPG